MSGDGAAGGIAPPCMAGCQLGLAPCLGTRTPRLCELAAAREDYRALLVERARPDWRAVRRAAKPRVPLGTPRPGPGGT